jgi:hypothetical protein
MLPLLLATIFFFRPIPLKKGLLDSVVASIILLVCFFAAASPALSVFSAVTNVGSCTWHFGLLGLSEVHTSMLGLAPANYSWLPHYDDGQLWRLVESYAQRALNLPNVGYCTPLYDQAGQALYFDIFRTFPGDFITRGLAAAKHVIGSGFWGIPWTQMAPSWDAFFSGHRGILQLVFIAFWAFLILVALARNVRIGFFAIFALVYLNTYPAIQFDLRHYFHLAFLTWLPVGVFLGWIFSAIVTALRKKSVLVAVTPLIKSPPIKAWSRAVIIAIMAFGIGYATFDYGRHAQAIKVQRLFDQYLQATGDEAIVASKTVKAGHIVWTLEAPGDIRSPEERGKTSRDQFGQRRQDEYRDNRRVHGYMLRLDIGGVNCTSGIKTISISLSGSGAAVAFPGYVYKRDFAFASDSAKQHAIVFIPIHLDKMLSTASLILPEESAGCIQRATWLHSSELPALWVITTLYPNLRESRLYQILW